MKQWFTFSLAAKTLDANQPNGSFMNRVVESVPASITHVVGVSSGLTGLALWAERAKHLTVLVGLAVAVMALAGGTFYAIYWAAKAWQAWRIVLRKRRKSP